MILINHFSYPRSSLELDEESSESASQPASSSSSGTEDTEFVRPRNWDILGVVPPRRKMYSCSTDLDKATSSVYEEKLEP